MFKVYKSLTGIKYNFLLSRKDGQTVMVMFTGSDKSYRTSDKELQGLIEDSLYFKGGIVDGKKVNKVIDLDFVSAETDSPIKPSVLDYVDITSLQEAKELLVKSHGVKESSLKTPDDIRKHADKLNIAFPNLKM